MVGHSAIQYFLRIVYHWFHKKKTFPLSNLEKQIFILTEHKES